jgi:hypothetical protein
MSNHGPLFDEFPAQSGEHHGGALADEGYRAGPAAAAGSLKATTPSYRDVTADGSGHGQHWDEFGFRQMPEHYGRSTDSDFTQPAMGDGAHGTWMDVFRGGTQVRADVNGIAGVEATVIQCHGDHAVLELRRPRHADGGGRVEVNIGQIREWRHATQQGQASETRKPTAQAGNTPAKDRPSSADAPSAHNATAHGGPRTDAGDQTTATEAIFSNKTIDATLAELRKIAGEG